ncbi:MAG TPA: glycosyltransferase [Acidimicrobiales bacterium]|nr:glycosyltransferase [Acidimicrobiales bacterium]
MSRPPADEAPPDLSFVLPSHNEITLLGSTVTNLVTGLEERGASYEILIVENGSRDGTLRLGRMLAAQLGHVRVLHLPVGDYGAALAAGFRAARGRFVVNFDVDYYDLAFLDDALAILGDESVGAVLASKRAVGATDRRPLHRRLLTAGFTTTLHLLLDLEVSDAHGMKVLRREELRGVVDECKLRGSLFDVELVTRATRGGLVVRELPATVVERRPPRSGVARRSVESLLGALRLRLILGAKEPPEADGGRVRQRLARFAGRG